MRVLSWIGSVRPLKIANSNHRTVYKILKTTQLYPVGRTLYHSWYRTSRMHFYSQFVRAGDLCFDLGANIGTRVEIFLKLGARVVAVEPQTTCFRQLQEKYGRNEQVSLIHAAVDLTSGRKKIYLCENDALSSMSKDWISKVKEDGRFSSLRWDKEEEVSTVTLDELITNFGLPAFCKIDVEGYESRVIRGMTRRIPLLCFEFSHETPEEAREIIHKLETLGDYKFNYCIGECNPLELGSSWVSASEMVTILDSLNREGDIFARCQV